MCEFIPQKPEPVNDYLHFNVPDLDFKKTVSDLFINYLEKYEDKILLTECNLISKYFKGSEILIFSRRLAYYLSIEGKIELGQKICIVSENRYEYLIIVIAAALFGAVIVPMNPYRRIEQIIVDLKKLNPSAIFVSHMIAPRMMRYIKFDISYEIDDNSGRKTALTPFSEMIKNGRKQITLLKEDYGNQESREFAILYSRTKSHSATISNRSLGYVLEWWPKMMKKHNHYGIAPFHTYYGLFSALTSICRGSRFFFSRQFEHNDFLENIAKNQIHTLYAVPSLCKFLLITKKTDNLVLYFLRKIVCGFDSLTPDDDLALRRKLNIKIQYNYGLIQTTYSLTHYLNPIRFGSVGTLNPNLFLKIINFAYESLGPNKRGEIWVKGPLISGNDHESQSSQGRKFLDGYTQTGDLGYYDTDGYVYIIGRMSKYPDFDVIEAISEEIEKVLKSHEAIHDAAVLCLKDIYTIYFIVKLGFDNINIEKYLTDKIGIGRLPFSIVYRPKRDFTRNIPVRVTRKVFRRRLIEHKAMLPDSKTKYPELDPSTFDTL